MPEFSYRRPFPQSVKWIPQELLSLSSLLFYLSLSQNFLSGPLLSKVARLQSLSYFYLSYNNFSNRIPDGLGQCLALKINISNHLFDGTIPASFDNLRGLTDLDFSCNKELLRCNPRLSSQIPRVAGRTLSRVQPHS